MNSIGHYFLRRCLLMIPTFFGITLITFLVMSLSARSLEPPEEAEASMGQSRLSLLDQRRIRETMGWDLPALLNLEIQDAPGFVTSAAARVAKGVGTLSHVLRDSQGGWSENELNGFFRELASAGRFLRDVDDLPVPPPSLREAWERYIARFQDEVVAWSLDAGRLMRLGGQTAHYLRAWLFETQLERSAGLTLLWIIGESVGSSAGFGSGEQLRSWLRDHPHLTDLEARKASVQAWYQQAQVVVARAKEAKQQSYLMGRERDPLRRAELRGSLRQAQIALKAAQASLQERSVAMRVFGALLLPELMAKLLKGPEEVKALASPWLRLHAAWDDSYDASSAFPRAEDDRLRTWWRQRKVTTKELGTFDHFTGAFTQTRYAHWLSHVLRWDFGVSWSRSRSVTELIAERFGATLLVQGAAFLLMFAMAIPLGLFAAARRGSVWDRGLKGWAALLVSMPTFLIATLLMLGLGGTFPLNGLRAPQIAAAVEAGTLSPWSVPALWDLLKHIILPSIALSLTSGAVLSRHIRAGMLKSLGSRWADGMRASGLPESRVRRLAWRTGMLPLVTLFGQLLPWLIGGSVVVEHMFGLPGLGSLAFEAATSNDVPLTMAIVTLTAMLTMVGYMTSDVVLAVLDPRVRLR